MSNGSGQPAQDELEPKLIVGDRPPAIGVSAKMRGTAWIVRKLDGLGVAYRYRLGGKLNGEVEGRGTFIVETREGKLRCRIQGDLFKATDFAYAFHSFWLTRRGIISAVRDLAEDRPPEKRGPTETFLHFELSADYKVRREAQELRRRLRERAK